MLTRLSECIWILPISWGAECGNAGVSPHEDSSGLLRVPLWTMLVWLHACIPAGWNGVFSCTPEVLQPWIGIESVGPDYSWSKAKLPNTESPDVWVVSQALALLFCSCDLFWCINLCRQVGCTVFQSLFTGQCQVTRWRWLLRKSNHV